MPISGILEIYKEAVLNTTVTYGYEPRRLEHRAEWFEDNMKSNYPVFVVVNGRPFQMGRLQSSDAGRMSCIWNCSYDWPVRLDHPHVSTEPTLVAWTLLLLPVSASR